MNKEILLLVDYKNRFESKWLDFPNRSGLDKDLLFNEFKKLGYKMIVTRYSELNINELENKIILYTSSEDDGLNYKSYIEDIIYFVENYSNAIVIPRFEFLKANNNKVFMELLKKHNINNSLNTLKSMVFGSIEDLTVQLYNDKIEYPIIVKSSAGAMSRGVFLAKNEKELIIFAKKVSYSGSIKRKIIERLRQYRHKGYIKESMHGQKFVLQEFIPGLKNDWKILIYNERYYILNRDIRKNDFRASGSGLNYLTGSKSEFPINMLNDIREFYKKLDVPNLSLDFGYSGSKGYVFEFQAIHFGTSTQVWSNDYYEFEDNEWKLKKDKFSQEEIYTYSIVNYLKKINE